MQNVNIEVISRNQLCHVKALHITYCVCVSVTSVIQHAMLYYTPICDLSDTTTFFLHYLTYGIIFRKKFIEHKKCTLIFSIIFV
jgi:hypothetical protein